MGTFTLSPACRNLRVLSTVMNVMILVALAASFGMAMPTQAAIQLGDIMPLGASITYGKGTPGGYRDPLYTLLTNHNYAFNFVGSVTENATPALTAAGQTHHEGHSGYTIQNRDPSDPTQTGPFLGGGILESLPGWIGPGAANPNYILLTIGTNDINFDYYTANAPNRLSNLISAISNHTTGLRPNAHLIVAEIPPTSIPVKNSPYQAYDAAIPGIVASHQVLGENVSFVDLYTPLNPATDFSDNLHPNLQGYDKVATAFFDGIVAAASTPEPTSLVWIGMGLSALISRRRSRIA